ncbi:hypothetical protein SS1G_11124 [Sclerotinia sclerotiorum 1980 UF-70]|uniref:Uncharacterized protein n=1 Tax=Sclerotinia sclerotiorum (strain ATCC 18683 / 1980 / Ss-1) TaxID=665079 RepID=A7F0K6_SCLS1|nr:hypothetical protein SS1G_11124 [Sclerotinia sclerotiorum 1980 UF-70]EDN95248.1 hypothetical protein SS1G_11124 [Sclerotinia sclerotiorum 1980 UF-70]
MVEYGSLQREGVCIRSVVELEIFVVLKSSKTLCEEPLKWDPNRRAASWLSKRIQRSVASLVDARVRAFAAPATAAVASASNTSAFVPNEKEWCAI